LSGCLKCVLRMPGRQRRRYLYIDVLFSFIWLVRR
jgi:hypothetical protein